MAKFNEYPAKTTPKDADKFMLYSAEDAANKLIDYDKLADAVLNKLTSKTFGLDAGTMTLPAALNQLNSKALRAINNEVNDWNSISQQGIYSGNGNAVNSPITGAAVWIDAIVMASNGNISYLNLLAVSTTGILLCRRMSKGTWENWNIINSNPKA